jgi:O-antigen ligase
VLFAAGIILSASRSNPSPHAASLPTRPRWKLGVILICVCIVGGIVGIEVLGRRDAESAPPESKVSIFVYETREMLHGNIRDEFATNRGYIWRNALGVFPKNPIIGSGPDTFFSAFPDEAQYAYGEPYDKAHNEYLQILICQGILGLIFYLVFLCGVIYRPVPAAFKNPIPMAVLAAFVGYCVQAFFNISLPIASQILWILAGMMCAMQGMGKRESIQALG